MSRTSMGALGSYFWGKACERLRDAVDEGLAALREDIDDPELTGTGSHPDAFLVRANELGFTLFDCGTYAMAERLYRAMAEVTESYRSETGNWRHAGSIYANIAAACAAQGNVDEAVVQLLKAEQDDAHTYPVRRPEQSPVSGDHLERTFCAPVRKDVLRAVQTVDPTVSVDDVESLGRLLGEREVPFLAYVQITVVHERADRRFPNMFSQIQLFSALRGLSCMLGEHLKALAGGFDGTFYEAAQALFGRRTWWRSWEQARVAVGETEGSSTPYAQRLRDALAVEASDAVTRFWRSLLVAAVVREYAVHQMEVDCALVQDYPYDALGHILHVFVAAPDYI